MYLYFWNNLKIIFKNKIRILFNFYKNNNFDIYFKTLFYILY